MIRNTLMITLALVFCLTGAAFAQIKTTVKMETSKGLIFIELDAKAAPKTVENFLSYVRSGAYDGTIFHRVMKEFMIQGGGFTEDMKQKPTSPPIQNEADNGLSNATGTIAMARTGDPHSATSQFFINVVDNNMLNHTAKTMRGWGYCVFGKVIKGIDVVHAIENVQTGFKGGHRDVPVVPVKILKVSILDPTPLQNTKLK